MMQRKKPNLAAAAIDVVFAIGAGAVGAFGLGWQGLIGVLLAHGVYWGASRWRSLRNIPRAHLVPTLGVSLALIAAVDTCAFLIASLFRR